ncbi:MAG: nucleoside deaminase [Legionellales bacterium]|nr:nucleoside deaminase [Legionellales bacterium]
MRLPNTTQLIDRLLDVTEHTIVPLTQAGVCAGNKIFGAAILNKADLSVVVAATNAETENPLWHGEIHALKKFYERPVAERPRPQDCLFFATHEPCPLCLSAITWGGYDNFYYLFSYADSRDAFHIPHDLKILKEVFRCDHGQYAHHNAFWHSYHLITLIDTCDDAHQQNRLRARVTQLKNCYAQMSDIYQQSKQDSNIPLN